MCSTPTPLKEACTGEHWVAYDHSLEDSYGLCILVKELKAENLENKKIICQLGHCVRKELSMRLRLIPLILWSNPLNVCEEVSSSVTFSTILICTATGRLVCLCFMQCKFWWPVAWPKARSPNGTTVLRSMPLPLVKSDSLSHVPTCPQSCPLPAKIVREKCPYHILWHHHSQIWIPIHSLI